MPTCPECGSSKVWKDGYRYTHGQPIQRYLCRSCGYRFSESIVKNNILSQNSELFHSSSDLAKQMVRGGKATIKKCSDSSLLSDCEDVRPQGSLPQSITTVGKDLNALLHYNSDYRICAPETKAAKNLVKVDAKTEVRTSPIEEKLVNYILYLKRLGRKHSTIETYNSYINILRKSNLDNPDEIALFINEHWKENSTRSVAVSAYDAYLKSVGKTWNKPKYKPESKKPFIPTDEMLLQAVMTGNKNSVAFSRLLYETGCRTNEAERLQWDDIDYARKKVYIRASKRGNARFISASDILLNMLSRLPRTNNENVFPKRGRNARRVSFSKRMKRLARLNNNHKYQKIHFHTFRHAFALRTYHRTKDILHVKSLLGHRSLLTTQRYVELYSQIYDSEEPNQFITKIAATKEERCNLINDGWTFIKNDGNDWYFRKPK